MKTISMLLLISAISGCASAHDEKWAEFSAEHCRMIAHERGQVIRTSDSWHSWYTITNDRATYACDDGVVYTR